MVCTFGMGSFKTLKISDKVLTVSVPLQIQLSRKMPVEIFYPFSDESYSSPTDKKSRNTLIFWGFINDKIDFDFLLRLVIKLEEIRSHFKLLFVGPIRISVKKFVCYKNIEFRPPASLDELDISDVFAGIIPYKNSIPSLDVITFPNKLIRLLSRGLPIAITGMPNFIDESFVFRLENDAESAIKSLEKINSHFDELQPNIKAFVSKHSAESRYCQFMSFCKSCVV